MARCTVHISVPTVDEEAWSALEPGTAHPLQRLRAVRALRKAGVNAGVLLAPIVPGFTTERRRLEATIRAVAEHDAAFMGSSVLYLKDGTKDHFMGFLREEFPHLVAGYERLYPGSYAPAAYVEKVKGLVNELRQRYAVGARASRMADDRARGPRPDDGARGRGAAGVRVGWLADGIGEPSNERLQLAPLIGERADARLGRRVRAEERHQASAGERLHDEHVRRGRVGVHRHTPRRGFDLAQRVGQPVRDCRRSARRRASALNSRDREIAA